MDIVGIGMACLDLIIRANELPTWQRGARLEAMGIEGGGPVATALAAASRLGASTGFLGTYGSDRMGMVKLQTLVDFGVDVSRAVRLDGPENQAVLVCVHAETGERIFSGGGSSHNRVLEAADLDRAYVTSARCLHLDGYHAPAARQAALWMRELGKPVMLDGSATSGPVSTEMRQLVELSDILICGSGFGPALTGKHNLQEAGAAILTMGPRIVVQTEGKDGCYTSTSAGFFHTPAFDVDVVDTTGAGDVFHGAFLVGMLRGWPLRTICQFSAAVSAIKCTHLGGRPGAPTFEATQAFLQERGLTLPPGRTGCLDTDLIRIICSPSD